MTNTKLEDLVGPNDGWDEQDNLVIIFYACTKFGGRNISVDLENGTLKVYNNDGATAVEEYDIAYILTKL